jgi:hypothetical protein
MQRGHSSVERNATAELCNVNMHYTGSEELNMATLTVTARGQVTFRKEVLQHLGIGPGDKIELDLLPG